MEGDHEATLAAAGFPAVWEKWLRRQTANEIAEVRDQQADLCSLVLVVVAMRGVISEVKPRGYIFCSPLSYALGPRKSSFRSPEYGCPSPLAVGIPTFSASWRRWALKRLVVQTWKS